MLRFLSIGVFIVCLGIPFNVFPNKCQNSFKIIGNIEGVKDQTKVYLIDIKLLKIVDSASTNSGNFSFVGKVSNPTSFWIKCLDEYAIIQVENVEIKFRSPLKEMKLKYVTYGGLEQKLQTKLNELVRPFEKIYTPAYDSILYKLYKDSSDLKRLTNIFNKANDKYMATYIDFGKKNINSYLGLDIVYMNRKSIQIDTIILLMKKLSPVLKETNVAKSLKAYTEEQIVKVGNKFIDFNAWDIKGNNFRFSSLAGRYIYLTFGSFGCAPCRIENQYISNNYKRLSKNIEFVNFSLDINDDGWKQVTFQDKIVWHNISDKAGMSGNIKTIYDVQVMPTSFLIDKNGVVIERFEGFSIENFKKIEALVGDK